MIELRAERAEDREAIARVHTAAFGGDGEARLVNAVRASPEFVPELSLVALEDGVVVGHVLVSRVALAGDDAVRSALALAPMGVAPTHQRRGIGAALIREALERADARGEPLVVVLGHAEYYPRFGFELARPLGIECPFPVRDEVWMARRLSAYERAWRGRVVYPPAFDTVT